MKTRTLSIDVDAHEREAATIARRFPVSISSTNPVERRDPYSGERFDEVLSHEPGAVDLSRAPLPLLESHDRSKVNVGVVTNLKLDGGRLRGELVLGASQRALELAADIGAGILTGLSVGYTIGAETRDEKAKPARVTATRWTPHEVSLVAIPADRSVGVNRSADPAGHRSTNMPEQTLTTTDPVELATRAERERISAITDLTSRHGLHALGRELVDQAVPLGEARNRILDALVTRSDSLPPYAAGSHIITGGRDLDGPEERISARAEALACRVTGAKPSDQARPFMTRRISQMAADLLEARGVSTRHMTENQLITRAGSHTTSDFPALCEQTGNRILAERFQAYTGGIQRISKVASAPDFRAKTVITFGEAPDLLKVVEGGEFTRGTMAEAKEAYSLATFGRIFSISRQALVNDDLNAFGDVVTRLGQAAAEFVAQQLVNLLAANPALSDGVATFHATHGNLAGTGAVISLTTLGEGLKSLRLRKGLNGSTPIDVAPRYLVVPAALEVLARQQLTAITPALSSSVNPFAGMLELVVDPRLDAKSATAWYLAADPSIVPGLEHAFLDSDSGPTIEARMGFDIDGLETKVRLDFGCGILDHRGLYKNAGA